MSVPVAIPPQNRERGRGSEAVSSSPVVTFASFTSSPCFAYGCSPPARSSNSGSDKNSSYVAAKKFWKRLLYDPSLDPSAFTVSATSATAVLALHWMNCMFACGTQSLTEPAVAQ